MKGFILGLALMGGLAQTGWSQESVRGSDGFPLKPTFANTSVGLYSLLADDDDRIYKSGLDWQPELHDYQQKGFNTLYLTFIRPDTMEVPPSFARLAKTRGTPALGAVPANTKVVFAIGGIAYSGSINPWPWLTSAQAARDMAAKVAKWTDLGADGIDLDIEDGAGNAPGVGANLIEFVRELKRLNPSILVSLPVYGYPQISAANELVNFAFGPNGEDRGLVDSVGIMVYEGIQALNYVGNYAKIPGSSRWEGFPITADVPKNKIILGLKGTSDDNTIRSMAESVAAQGYGGVMVWYGSLLDQQKQALQYARDWDASQVTSSQWQVSRGELENK